ncbi:hypothetical protein CG51_11340 [Haematobacter missouriensis]|nr:hypothetical protein CG51_11340 [Haematobacter missouriensis]
MRVILAAEFREHLDQGRPVPVPAPQVELVVECLGIAIIGVDQTREHHPPGNREVETCQNRIIAHLRLQFRQNRSEVDPSGRSHFPRHRIARAEEFKPPFQAGFRTPGIR